VRALSLFSGIAGLDLAAHAAGIETVAFCEIEPFAVQVLERRWPGVPIIDDVRKIRGCDWTVDVVHGGFPCQDLSVAGKQAGLEGERSGLWYEMLRVISELRPRYVLAENVRGAVNLALDTVYSNLVNEGYKVYPYVIPASAVGAPHQRERLFVLGVRRDVADPFAERLQRGERGYAFLEQGAPALEPASERCEGSLWPTPRAGKTSDEKLDSWLARRERGEVATPPLSLAVRMWATPSSADCKGSHGGGQGRSLRTDIHEIRKMWPTPFASSATIQDMEQAKFSGNDPNRPKYSEVKSVGSLNPAWVEILMGYPLGWTDPDCDEPEPWPGWPAMMGESQYPYEPPRTGTGIPHRAARLKALGNSVVPAQAYPFFEAIRIMEEVRQWSTKSST